PVVKTSSSEVYHLMSVEFCRFQERTLANSLPIRVMLITSPNPALGSNKNRKLLEGVSVMVRSVLRTTVVLGWMIGAMGAG
ncbi:MAG TPA: hypothetical protein VFV92_10320, partial [Candidatus Bathyarchaeia archaeon]|nr:hypothetical protein [Candidatus Bathyarchaeia archaeon]